jgi:hypothetical protein
MDAKAAAEEDSLQIVKIVMIYFFTALSIEGYNTEVGIDTDKSVKCPTPI